MGVTHPLRAALAAADEGRSITEALTGADIAGLGSPALIEAMYEAQAGTYTAEQNADALRPYTRRVCQVFVDHVGQYDDVLDVGTGEANRLINALHYGWHRGHVSAVDLSWSRLSWAQANAHRAGLRIDFAVAEAACLPIADGSVDWVTSVHALEPNAGREAALLAEMSRVARKGVLLIEPDWEIADDAQRARMTRLGFVRGLREAAEQAGLTLMHDYPLQDDANSDNPASVLVLVPARRRPVNPGTWRDPVDGEALLPYGGGLRTPGGLFYPVLDGIPFLRRRDALMAAKPAPGPA